MAKKRTEADVIREFQSSHELTPSELADAFGVSRQTVHNWLTAVHLPSSDWLTAVAMEERDWKQQMAVDLLTLRGAAVPCVCLEKIGDNGPCPKHTPPLTPPHLNTNGEGNKAEKEVIG